jgi:hypothetical protein
MLNMYNLLNPAWQVGWEIFERTQAIAKIAVRGVSTTPEDTTRITPSVPEFNQNSSRIIGFSVVNYSDVADPRILNEGPVTGPGKEKYFDISTGDQSAADERNR